jgi:hypothetical protein
MCLTGRRDCPRDHLTICSVDPEAGPARVSVMVHVRRRLARSIRDRLCCHWASRERWKLTGAYSGRLVTQIGVGTARPAA